MGAALIVKEQTIEVARIAKEIAVTQSEEQRARAEAAKALAVAEEEKAKQSIVTVETTSKAQREKAIQVIQAEADAEKQRIAAEGRAMAALKEAEAMVTLANAITRKGAAEADVRRMMVEAENGLALKYVLRDVALKAIDAMPELARELMTPAKAIREIKVLQTGGFGGGGGASDGARPALGAMSPILKSVLEAGAAYPLLRELMSFAKVDGDDLRQKMQGALDELSGELESIVKKEEPLAREGNGPDGASAAPRASEHAGA